MEPKKLYEKEKKKHKNLPEWKWLIKNFKISMDECEDIIFLDRVMHAVTEKLDSLNKGLIEPIISGGENFCCFFERKMLSESEKEKLFDIYKAIQHFVWWSGKINLEQNESECVKWLAKLKKEWEKLRPELIRISGTISKGWKTYKKKDTITAYHG